MTPGFVENGLIKVYVREAAELLSSRLFSQGPVCSCGSTQLCCVAAFSSGVLKTLEGLINMSSKQFQLLSVK